MLDVVTIGSATLDIFIKSDQFIKGSIGEGKIEAQELIMASGGGATNNAVSFARKGFAAAPIIEMGTDPAAEMIISELKKESVNIQLVIQEEKETTAVSIIPLSGSLVDGGKSSILTYRGASRMLAASDIPFDKLGFLLKPSGWIHLTSIGSDLELVKKIISWAKEKRRKIFWNPGVAEISEMQSFKGLSLPNQGQSLWPILNSVSVLQINKKEAQSLFESQIPNLPNTILIITNGENGGEVYLPAKAGQMRRAGQGQKYSYSGIKTTMIDSTGAGDAFGSSFVAALLLGKPIFEAIEWGRKQSANVVKYIGAKKGLMTKNQLENNPSSS